MSEITVDLMEMYVNKFKCDETFDSDIDCQLLVLYSKAYLSYLRQNQDSQATKKNFEIICIQLGKIEKIIHQHLQFSDKDFFHTESTVNPSKKQVFGQRPQKRLFYALVYIQTAMQNIAFLSYMQENEQALAKALRCFEVFQLLFKALAQTLDYIVVLGPENLKSFNFASIEDF